ncbi:MAG: thiosulfate oxidation carrier protein SoxY [Methylococcales bacterium]|nr:thiosulfate oxidation carrier protein SoxY [Methylococcales bacterium]MCK5926100.1 thiosulfate oxidation carrier protein SoxY [Methylococcales bacterium]
MTTDRRVFLKKAVAITGGGLLFSQALDAKGLSSLFIKSSLYESVRHTFKNYRIHQSDKIDLKIPTIAENGAVVPLTVTSFLDNTEQIYIFVEKNPIPLVAIFDLSPMVESLVSARIKMAKTSDVVIIVKAQSRLYQLQREVKVTIGGCGG